MKENQSINVIKGGAAILVIVIHAPMKGSIGQAIISVARSGVALFFLISGFYMPLLGQTDIKECAKRKLLRTIRLTGSAYVFYFFWGIFLRWVGTGISSVLNWFTELFTIRTVIQMFLFQSDVFAGHLWFLNALILCYLMVFILGDKVYKTNARNIAWLLLGIHFIIGNILPSFAHRSVPMSYYRNGWLYGIPFFVLGIHLRKWYSENTRSIKNNILVRIIVISMVLLMIERYLTGYHQLYFFNIPLLFGMYCWCIQHPLINGCKKMQRIGSAYYSDIYIFQWAVINVVDKIFRMFGFQNSMVFMIVSICGTLALAVCYGMVRGIVRRRCSAK